MDIGVIGLGSMGLFISAKLSTEHQVTGYVRQVEQKKKINQHGVMVDQQAFLNINVRHISELVEHDLLIICVKQTQLDSLIPFLKQIKSTNLLFLQNGLGHIDKVSGLEHKILLGISQHGVTKFSANQVRINGLGQIRIGSVQDLKLAQSLQQTLNSSNFPIVYDDDIIRTIQEKLVINSVINPITALFEIQNGEVLDNQYLKRLAVDLTNEAAKTFSFNPETCWELIETVARNTSKNYSSMLGDIQSKRPTEIDFINGYIIQHSADELPIQQCMYQLIKAKENSYKRS